MIIDCISDLHGDYPKLSGGDLLLIAGDFTARDTISEYLQFREWLREQDYKKKIFVAGNHDVCLENGRFYFNPDWMEATYLKDSGTEFEGQKIWGSPWTNWFYGVNPDCAAFMLKSENELHKKFCLIPDDTNILITHSPPFGILDSCHGGRVGSQSLREHSIGRVKPMLHVFGHIHEGYGEVDLTIASYINAAHMDGRYKPVNKPIRMIYDKEKKVCIRDNKQGA